MRMSVMSAVHTLAITYDGKNAVATPSELKDMGNGETLQINSEAGNGETLQIYSGDGTFRVVFKPWPFRETEREVKDSESLTFYNEGPDDLKFEFDCYITPPGMTEVGYGTSGGNGNVKPPGR